MDGSGATSPSEAKFGDALNSIAGFNPRFDEIDDTEDGYPDDDDNFDDEVDDDCHRAGGGRTRKQSLQTRHGSILNPIEIEAIPGGSGDLARAIENSSGSTMAAYDAGFDSISNINHINAVIASFPPCTKLATPEQRFAFLGGAEKLMASLQRHGIEPNHTTIHMVQRV